MPEKLLSHTKDVLTLTDILWEGFVALAGLTTAGAIFLFTRLSSKVDKMTPLETYKKGQKDCEKRQAAILEEVKQIRKENREDNRTVHKRMDDLLVIGRSKSKPDNKERRRDID